MRFLALPYPLLPDAPHADLRRCSIPSGKVYACALMWTINAREGFVRGASSGREGTVSARRVVRELAAGS